MSDPDPGLDALIHQIAHDSNVPDAVVRKAITDLVNRGHLRLIPNPGGPVGLEFILKGQPR